MKRRFVLVAIFLIVLVVPVLIACSSGNGTDNTNTTTSVNNTLYKPVWINPTVGDGTISISLATVQKDTMTHFKANLGSSDESFMAYEYQGRLLVRADICVPCQSINFALKGNQLICMSCGTVFTADTGSGVSGACRNFPKASIAYQVNDGQVVMNTNDLLRGYQDTLQPG